MAISKQKTVKQKNYKQKIFINLFNRTFMKRIAIVVVSTILLAAGCQKTEIVNPAPEPSMVFTTGMTKLTKASGKGSDAASAGTDNLKAQDFRVWAYANYEDAINNVNKGNVYDGMQNLNVYYNAVTTGEEGSITSESWSTNKEYYWPGTDKNLLFFAVSGADYGDDLDKTQTVVTPNFTDKSIAVSEFSVDPSTPNTDLMVADVVDQHQGDKEVNLTFHHALSKVEFLFKTVPSENMRVLVQGIEVEGLVSKAGLSVTAAAEGVQKKDNANDAEMVTSTVYPVSFAWTPANENATATFVDDYKTDYEGFDEPWGEGNNATTEIELVDGTKVDPEKLEENESFDTEALLLDGDAEVFATWLMIPQDITGKTVKVTYIINSRQFEAIFKLDHASLIAGTGADAKAQWGDNKYVRYTVTLSPNVISFSPSVDDWEQHDANDTSTEGTPDNTKDDIEMQN